MKIILSTIATLFLLFFIQVKVNAQVKTKIYFTGVPQTKISKLLANDKELKITAPPNFENLLNNKQVLENAIEYKNKFAKSVKVEIDFIKTAFREEQNGNIIYTLTLNAENALNISLQFDEFKLSNNSFLSIFTSHEITDSITSKENNPKNIWATRVYQGSTLHVVLITPKDEERQTKLKINQVSFGFLPIGADFFGNSGASATCNINVLCAEGNGWQNERNSVALIVSNSNEICTGTLIMNTCGTNIPYLLTANHCLNSNVQNWVFQFQTWSATCTPNGTFREDIQFNGCQLRANNAATDFALVELNQIPPPNSGITYSGWSRANTPATSSTSIHHPMGDLMKISLSNQLAVSTPWISGASNHWRASFNQGIVQHGSSGAALFDQNHRIVGQLHGNQVNQCQPGQNNCWCITQIPSIGEYGRFDISWAGGGTNATRLSNWLDPNNTGAMATNTTDMANLISVSPTDYLISGLAQFCTSGNYSITNLPAGATVQWNTTSIYGQHSKTITNNVLTLNRVTDGSAIITATITLCGNTIQVAPMTVQVGGTVITVTATQTSCDEVMFNVSGAASSATYNWSSNGNTILYNGTNITDYSSVGQINAVVSGFDIAKVNTTNTCGQSVNVGGDYNPYQREIIGLYPEYICGDHVSVSINTTVYDSYYKWYINNTLVKQGSDAFFYCTCDYQGPDARVNAQNTIKVEVETSCGITSFFDAGFWMICGYYKTHSNVELFPNPARDQVTINLKQINVKQTTGQLTEIREVRILDKLGAVKKVLKYSANTKTINVNVSTLSLDIYYIEVSDYKNKAKLPLSIQK